MCNFRKNAKYVYVYVYACICTCTCICIYAYAYAHAYLYVYTYTRTYARTHIHTYIIYIYIYIDGLCWALHYFLVVSHKENVRISIKISLQFVPRGPINNNPKLIRIMAWRRSGDKPLSEPMMVSLLTHLCVTRPQWVNGMSQIRIHLYTHQQNTIHLFDTKLKFTARSNINLSLSMMNSNINIGMIEHYYEQTHMSYGQLRH